MKKILTVLALALLLLPAAGAQEATKMNKKNLVVKEWNTDPKGGNKVLDHVTTFSATMSATSSPATRSSNSTNLARKKSSTPTTQRGSS